MKGLRKLFEEVINEITVSQIREKYYSDIDEGVFNEIVSADPKTKKKGGEIKKIGKYAKVLLDMYKKGNLKLEDLPKANEYLGIIYAKQIPLNIKSVGNLPDIYAMVKDYIISPGETDITKLIDSLEKEDYKLLNNGDRWLIFEPKTERGACILGSGTQWCTAWGKYSTNPSYKGRSNHFKGHAGRGTIYTLIDKKDNSNKYQFHIESNQFKNKNDGDINKSDFLGNNREVLLFFNPELKGDLDDLSDSELDTMVGRQLITNDIRKEIIGALVNKNKDKKIINIFLEAQKTSEYDKINAALNSSDFEIIDIPSKNYHDIKFKELNDEDLSIYDNIGSHYYDNDPYIDEEEPLEYYGSNIDEIFRKNSKHLIKEFNDEGLDIKKFLDEKNINYDIEFLKMLFNDSGKKDKFLESISDIIYNAKSTANTDARDNVYNKSSGFFQIDTNEISLNIFLLFLIRYDEYDMENFKEFLQDTFDMPVEYRDIYEEIQNLEWELLNVETDEILLAYDNIQSDLVEWFMEYYEDEIEDFRSTDVGYLEKEHGDVFKKLSKIMRDLKFDMTQNNEFENDIVKVRIDFNRVRPTRDDIYMDITNKETGKTNSGFIKLDNIASQFTNYKLFEELNRFKRYIK
tara:strand:+ start:6584 stop:8473 length:1890 start_codon:yes stop_codon:yes gene_type:complete